MVAEMGVALHRKMGVEMRGGIKIKRKIKSKKKSKRKSKSKSKSFK